MRGYLKQISWTAVLAAATAFAQTPTPPAPPDVPATPPAETPDQTPAPRVRNRTPKPPKPPKIAHAYAYTFNEGEGASYLGVGVRDVTHETMSQLKLKDEVGVEVTSIDSEGPAAKAGLKEHDVILTFNGQTVEGYEQLRRMIRETPAGRTVKLGVSRAGQQLTLGVPLAKREEFSFVRPNIVPMPPINIPAMNFDLDMPGFAVLQITSRSGATVEDLTPQLGDFFGAKGGEGVLVRNVERGSPAESAGLKAGDVIVKVGQERVANATDWRRLMRTRKGGPIGITVLRDKREQNLSLKLPERSSSDASFQFEFPDVSGFNAVELGKLMKQLGPQIERAQESAMIGMKNTYVVNERELERQIERSMREMERGLEQQRKAFEKMQDQDKE
jgi:membrane-associated protease RseP (regulator of RpoE activity)